METQDDDLKITVPYFVEFCWFKYSLAQCTNARTGNMQCCDDDAWSHDKIDASQLSVCIMRTREMRPRARCVFNVAFMCVS